MEDYNVLIMEKQLIKIAENLDCTQWYEIDKLIKKTSCEKTKKILKNIQIRLYHKEEYLIGNL